MGARSAQGPHSDLIHGVCRAMLSYTVHPQGVAGYPVGLCGTPALTTASLAVASCLLRVSACWGHHSCYSEFLPQCLVGCTVPICALRHVTRHGVCFSKSWPFWEEAGRVAHSPTTSVPSLTLTWLLAFHFLGTPGSLCSKTLHANEVMGA